MKKHLTVDEVITEITAKKKTTKEGTEKWLYNRFNKRSYNELLKAMLNDPELKAVTVKLKDGAIESTEDIMVTKAFREFLRKILVKAGVDAHLSKDFTIDNTDGLYEFFATSMYLYMNAGNRFDLITTPTFKGTLFLEDVPETKKVADARNPKTKEYIATYESTKAAHQRLGVKSSCPSWLVSRKVVKK
jgi:hypothetical protein